jgi:hypothetical protein
MTRLDFTGMPILTHTALRLIVGYGFSSIKLLSVTSMGAKSGPVGYEVDNYLAHSRCPAR